MPGADAVDVSVLVPVLNEAAHLPEVAPQMLGQRFDGEIEFLFIDGGSSDGTQDIVAELARSDPRVRLLENPERVTPAALNRGLAAARGRYVARMDAHSHYPDTYLAAGVARLQRGDVAHVSGPQVAGAFDDGSRRVALALRSRLGVGAASFRLAADELEVDSGFLGVWRRDTLERLGGWDREWVINQDAELAARLRADGGRLVCIPEMAATYLPRNTLKGLARQYFRYGNYRARTSLRHPDSVRLVRLMPPGLVLTLAASVLAPRPLRRLARVGLGAYGAAVLAESVRLAHGDSEAQTRDGLMLPAVFATMHLAWGAGMLAGFARFARSTPRHRAPA